MMNGNSLGEFFVFQQGFGFNLLWRGVECFVLKSLGIGWHRLKQFKLFRNSTWLWVEKGYLKTLYPYITPFEI